MSNIKNLKQFEKELSKVSDKWLQGQMIKILETDNPEIYMEFLKDRKKRISISVKKAKENYQKKRYDCECGKSIRYNDKAKHLKSIFHQRFLGSDCGNIRIYTEGSKNDIIQCNCGGKYVRRGANRHEKTEKHKDYINNIIQLQSDKNAIAECSTEVSRLYKLTSPSSKYIYIGSCSNGKQRLINHLNSLSRTSECNFTNGQHQELKYKYILCKYGDYKIKYIKKYASILDDRELKKKRNKMMNEYWNKKQNVISLMKKYKKDVLNA